MERTQRTELKFPVSKQIVPLLQRDVRQFLVFDENSNRQKHNKSYQIRSLYFESPDNFFYREKLAGIRERVKLRIRSYLPITSVSNYYLEIKYKNDIKQKKLRTKISHRQYAMLTAGMYHDLLNEFSDDEVLILFITFILKYRARPFLCIDYDRSALVSRIKSHYIRVTFDTNLSFHYAHNIRPELSKGSPCIDPKYVILEMKFERNIPHWMHILIIKYNLRASAISKYAIALRQLAS